MNENLKLSEENQLLTLVRFFEGTSITHAEIQVLVKALRSLDYHSALPIAERITNLPYNFHPAGENPDDKPGCILLNDFHDPENNREGICQDLAIRFLYLISKAGLINKLRQSGYEIKKTYGQSEKFFNTKDQRHVWIEISNPTTQRGILIDTSFSTIETLEETKYNKIDGLSMSQITIYPNQELLLTEISDFASYLQKDIPTKKGCEVILGLSSDGKAIFSMGYINIDNRGTLFPYLVLSFEDADAGEACVTYDGIGEVVVVKNNDQLTSQQIMEATHILKKISDFKIDTDDEQFDNHLHQKKVINL